MKEIFKDVKSKYWSKYYQISNHGRVRSKPRWVNCKNGAKKKYEEKIRRQFITDGRLMVTFVCDGNYKTIQVYRLVAEVFCNKPKGCDYVVHNDMNQFNNHYDNLKWVKKGEIKRYTDLDQSIVSMIREQYNIAGLFCTEIAKQFGLSVPTITNIVYNNAYKDPNYIKKDWGYRGKGNAKLTIKDVKLIRFESKLSPRQLATKFNMTESAIRKIKGNITWKNV